MKYLSIIVLSLSLISCGLLEEDNPSDVNITRLEYDNNMSDGSSLEAYNNILAVTDRTLGVLFYDISEQSNPKKISSYQINNSNKTRIYNNYAYIISGTDGSNITDNKITILDIADLNNPKYVSEISFINVGREVLLENNNLFLAAGESGLIIYDISDKSQPIKISSYYEQFNTFYGSNITDVEIDNSLLFLSDFYKGVRVIDISNITNPIKISEYVTAQQNNCHQIELFDGKVIMQDFWDYNYDILELDINNVLDSVATISFNRDYDLNPTELIVSDNSLFASAWWQHALEYDLTDLNNVTIKNEWELPGHQSSIAVASNYIYVLHQEGIEIIQRN